MNENNDPLFEHTWEQTPGTLTIHFNKIFSKDVHRIRFAPSAVIIELNSGLEFIGTYLYPVSEAEYLYDDHLIIEVFKKDEVYFDQIFPESDRVDISKIQPKRTLLTDAPKDMQVFVENLFKSEVFEKQERKKILNSFMEMHPELDFTETEVNWK